MRISVLGSGYVGLVQEGVFSEVGHQITCMDIDPARIAQNTLCFTDDTAEAVEASDYLFICVGTPAAAEGSADLQYVMSVAEGIAAHMTSRKVVVNKSSFHVGTADKVAECIAAGLVIYTEWKLFRAPDFEDIKCRLTSPVIIDGRNRYNREDMEAAGIEYFGIGRGRSVTRT